MPRNGSGTATIPNTFTAGTTIRAADVNANFSDIASMLTASLPRDGQAAMTADLPMGGFKATNLGAPTSSGDAVTKGYLEGTALASQAEAEAGTSTTKLMVPARVKDQIATYHKSVVDAAQRGAVFDGTTNNHTLLTTLITELKAAGGGTLRIAGEGTCRINSSLDISDADDIRIEIMPDATLYCAAAGSPVLISTNSAANPLNRFMMDGGGIVRGAGRTNAGSHGISVDYSNSCRVANLMWYGCDHIFDIHHAFQFFILNNTCEGSGSDQSNVAIHQGAVLTTDTTDDNAVRAVGNHFKDLNEFGAEIINGNGSDYIGNEFGAIGGVGVKIGGSATATKKTTWLHGYGNKIDSVQSHGLVIDRGSAADCGQIEWFGWIGNVGLSGTGDAARLINAETLNMNLMIVDCDTGIYCSSVNRSSIKANIRLYNQGNNGKHGIELVNSSYNDVLANTHSPNSGGSPVGYLESGTSNYNALFGYHAGGITLGGANSRAYLSDRTVLRGLNTSSAGLAAGTLWNDGGTIKVV